MPDHRPRRSSAGRGESRRREAAAKEATKAREQASRLRGGPDADIATDDAKRPTITLKTGAIVDAREAVAVAEQLRANLAVHPDEFESLLALAEGRAGEADSRHFHALRVQDFLEKDGRSIRPLVRDVLLNTFEATHEGPVVAPLRLHDETQLPAAEAAQDQLDRQLRDSLFGGKGKGRSMD